MYCYVSFTRPVSVPVPSTYYIVSMVTDKLGSEPILFVNVNLKVTVTETVRVNGSYILLSCPSLL